MLFTGKQLALAAVVITPSYEGQDRSEQIRTQEITASKLARANLRVVGISGAEAHKHPLPHQAVAAVSGQIDGAQLCVHELNEVLKADRAWRSTTECMVMDFMSR